jgi:hypothetical protein
VDLNDRGTAVFAVHSDLRVRFRRESTNGALSDWMSFGSRRALAVTPLASKAGRLIVLLLSPTGAIEASFERLNGTFSPWRRIGSPIDVFVSAPQASVLRDGRIEAHAVGWGGVVYRTRTDGSAGWEPWQTLSGPVAGAGAALNPALVQTSAGRLAVLTRGSDGFAYLNRQLVEHGPWSGWSRVGRRAVSSDVAAVATGATLHAFARDTATGQVWSASGSIDDAEFSESVLDGPAVLLSAPAAVVSPNGELRLAVVGPWANLHWNRRRPPEPWAGWNAMPRKAVWFRPALLPLADARWGVYAVALSGGSLVRARELLGWTSFTDHP